MGEQNQAVGSVTPPPTPFYRQLQIAAMSLLIFVLLLHLLQTFATVLQELLVAAFIAYLILPAHAWLVRHRVTSLFAFVVIVVVFLAGCYLLGQMTFNSVAQLHANLPQYEENAANLLHDATGRLPPQVLQPLEEIQDRHKPSVERTAEMVEASMGTFFGYLSQALVVLVYLIFLLSERVSLSRRVRAGFPAERAQRIMAIVGRINADIHQYIAVMIGMSVLSGAATTIVLFAFGVDYAVFWGIVAFLLNFIPYLGTWVAVGLPVALSLVQFGSLGKTAAILLILLAVQNAIAYVIQPRLAGRKLNLSPFVIIVSLSFWGIIWGITGMILAVPLVVVCKAILDNFPETKPLATMLSNE